MADLSAEDQDRWDKLRDDWRKLTASRPKRPTIAGFAAYRSCRVPFRKNGRFYYPAPVLHGYQNMNRGFKTLGDLEEFCELYHSSIATAEQEQVLEEINNQLILSLGAIHSGFISIHVILGFPPTFRISICGDQRHYKTVEDVRTVAEYAMKNPPWIAPRFLHGRQNGRYYGHHSTPDMREIVEDPNAR